MIRYMNNDVLPKKGSELYNKLKKKAETLFKKEEGVITAAREHVFKKAGNKVQFAINGGSLGFLAVDLSGINTRTPLSTLNEAFNPMIADKAADRGEQEGLMYFTTDGMYGQPVAVERPTVEESGLGTMLADLIVEDLTDENGQPLSASERQSLLDQYLETDKRKVSIIIPEGSKGEYVIMLYGQALPHNTIEEKANTKAQILKYLVQRRQGQKPMNHKDALYRAKQSKKKIVKNAEDGSFGDILEITKEVNNKKNNRI